MKLVRIVYTSISGNTELVCQKAAEIFQAQGLSVSLEKCQQADIKHLLDCDCLIFACPTYAHGELQAYFTQFLEKLGDLQLDGQSVAVIGLGDPKYDVDYNIEAAQILSDWFEAHGANQIIEPLKVNKSPLPQLNELVETWAKELGERI